MSTDKAMTADTLLRRNETRDRQTTAATGTDKPVTAGTLLQRAIGGDRR